MSPNSPRIDHPSIAVNMSAGDSSRFGNQHFLLINKTLINVQIREPYRDNQRNELLYVIVVIVFYATALMTLIISQIKRQRRDGSEIDYYDEYLQRNSEVKHTCQIASSIVARQKKKPPPAVATAAFAAAATGTVLGQIPLRHDDTNERSSNDEGMPNGETDTAEVMPNHGASGSTGALGSRILCTREKSPILESIPDTEN
ncbi:unnamed protein product [Candidula unifasciata]|uniref:Uncharacterized protein n=1 Tax=Candidula unifasciata TaxID=100452 RepID=A0A8S3Z366_9EUPU|nr:unnamed protein product [Candidula unifasciata]